MATETALEDVLSSFTTASKSALEGLPESETLLPPQNGISLLDAKNEIFLSYLQALALRNLNVIRLLKNGASQEDAQKLSDKLTLKLLEHRIYLERGVRPLEQKIKYQVDKVVKTADDEERLLVQKASAVTNGDSKKKDNSGGSDEESDSESGESEDEELDTSAYRPNAAAFASTKRADSEQDQHSRNKSDGVYRPPRISATSMPTTTPREQKERRQPRSATLDEYVNTELSTAPVAEPSIGSTIAAGGRRQKDARSLAKEQERREYEETHLVRLPLESKKERAKQAKRERAGFGGEEWRNLGQSVDRIGDLTKRKGGKDGVLERSRKRRAVEDGPRDDGVGGAFEAKKRRVMKKMKR